MNQKQSYQFYTGISLGLDELIRIGDLDIILKVTAGLKPFCVISHEPVSTFLPNLLGLDDELIRFLSP